MAKNWKTGALFAAGLVVGVAAGVAAVIGLGQGHGPARAHAPSVMGASAGLEPMVTPGPAPRCADLTPLLGKSPDGDGRENLQAAAGSSAIEISNVLLKGKEASAGDRPRDAEVLFLNACRSAQAMRDGDVPAADAQYQLARHYANAAAFGAPRSRELYERANRLYGASFQTYRTRLGAEHEKTRFAREGLITVQQVTGVLTPLPGPAVAEDRPAAAPAPASETVAAAPTAPPEPVPAPVAVTPAAAPRAAPAAAPARPAEQVASANPAGPVAAAKPEAVTAPTASAAAAAAPRTTSPSFNCAQARSTTEKLICGDEELARMDRDLGRLHQRAKQAAADPRAFQRNSDAEWQRREDTCTDRDCLRAWYAERRQELSAAAEAARPAARAPRPDGARSSESTADAASPAPRRAAREEPAGSRTPVGTASGDVGTATGSAGGSTAEMGSN